MECVALTVDHSHHFEVVIPQRHPARVARETLRMEFLPPLRLQVLALNTIVAGSAEGAVHLVVVMRTVRMVVHDVKVGGLEGGVASPAGEALLVPTPCKPPIGRLDALPHNQLATASAVPLTRRARPLSYRSRSRA